MNYNLLKWLYKQRIQHNNSNIYQLPNNNKQDKQLHRFHLFNLNKMYYYKFYKLKIIFINNYISYNLKIIIILILLIYQLNLQSKYHNLQIHKLIHIQYLIQIYILLYTLYKKKGQNQYNQNNQQDKLNNKIYQIPNQQDLHNQLNNILNHNLIIHITPYYVLHSFKLQKYYHILNNQYLFHQHILNNNQDKLNKLKQLN